MLSGKQRQINADGLPSEEKKRVAQKLGGNNLKYHMIRKILESKESLVI
jgi:hypothetical protein